MTDNQPKSSKDSLSEKYNKFDRIARDADEDPECQDKDQLNSFFQNIYKNMDEDGRRAMQKSFVESAGTVLSTNWNDVGKGKVGVKPPEGMEHKQYEK